MRRWSSVSIPVLLLVGLTLICGCKKNTESPTGPPIPLYSVTATVTNPLGLPQGGARLSLKTPPPELGRFTALTDNNGRATIQAPAGKTTLVARIGIAFEAALDIAVGASPAGDTITSPIQLQQDSSVRVLVVQGQCETLESVLRKIGYASFDSMSVTALRDSARADSNRILTQLRKYTLIFSDCDCGNEHDFPLVGRIYGRFVAAGGNMYGGHYNYYNLQAMFPSTYTKADTTRLYMVSHSTDSLSILDAGLRSSVGYSVVPWESSSPKYLSGYERFTNLPQGSQVYAIIYRTNSAVIVMNFVGTGEFLWTDYHNQDITGDPELVRIINYFLLAL